ncbi:MAG: polyprenyl synthetase family protein [Erysipelothrix sp.]|nr:polyprenyl synthetase family protein [Erysipelothrix sp.]
MIEQLELVLKEALESKKPSLVIDAMEYSLLSVGKRVRPHLTFKLLHDYGIEDERAVYAAAAVECIHTYSLIHDDLPALDNDDMRRFKPTNHIVYGEDIAILAGDGLLTLAFELLAKAKLDAKYFEILARNAGTQGMILGQEIDIKDSLHSLEELERCYELKTGALFSASLEFAAHLANDLDNIDTVKKIAVLLGIVFQFQDDLLEVQSDAQTIGKSTDSDAERNISTITSYMTLDEALVYVDDMFEKLDKLIDTLNLKNNTLKEYIKVLTQRKI